MDDKYIIALEIGSSKISGAIGVVDSEGTLTVKAVEEEPLVDSVRYGQLSNIKVVAGTADRILRKIENRVSPRKVKALYIGVGGRSMSTMPVEVERRMQPETEVTEDLLDRLKVEARTHAVTDKEIIEVVPREYIIDNSRAERPEGMYCTDIRMSANLIVCRPQLKRNLDLLVDEKLQLKVAGYISRPLAEAQLVLTYDEKKLGCMLVDFGAETTTVCIYRQGTLQYLATIPIGSRNITRDISTLNHVEEDAEELKKTRGSATPCSDSGDAMSLADMNNLVSHRAAEIIVNIKEQIKYAGFTSAELPGGIVLIGRGAKLSGFSARLEDLTKMKVRSGSAMSSGVRIADSRISPSEAVDVISLLAVAASDPKDCLTAIEKPAPEPEPEVIKQPSTGSDASNGSNWWRGLVGKAKQWVTDSGESEEDEDFFADDDEK